MIFLNIAEKQLKTIYHINIAVYALRSHFFEFLVQVSHSLVVKSDIIANVFQVLHFLVGSSKPNYFQPLVKIRYKELAMIQNHDLRTEAILSKFFQLI